MKTQNEIVERINSKKESDVFGFEREVLVYSLDFEHASELKLPKEGVTAEQWNQIAKLTDEALKKDALGYIEFAWGKAQDHRGISAERSVMKLTQYLWLLGHDDLVQRIESDEIPYAQYGCPILKVISETLGAKVPDDAETRRMMEGSPCVDGCENGCGS